MRSVLLGLLLSAATGLAQLVNPSGGSSATTGTTYSLLGPFTNLGVTVLGGPVLASNSVAVAGPLTNTGATVLGGAVQVTGNVSGVSGAFSGAVTSDTMRVTANLTIKDAINRQVVITEGIVYAQYGMNSGAGNSFQSLGEDPDTTWAPNVDLKGSLGRFDRRWLDVEAVTGKYNHVLSTNISIAATVGTVPATVAGQISLFATNTTSAKLYSKDGDGNVTLQSPHDGDRHMADSYNEYTGEGAVMDLREQAKAVQAMISTMAAKDAAITNGIDVGAIYQLTVRPRKDWDAEQAAHVAKRDAEIVAAEAAIAAWEADPKPDKGEKPVKPDKLKAAPKPKWLTDWEAER